MPERNRPSRTEAPPGSSRRAGDAPPGPATVRSAWQLEALWQQLEPLLPGLSVEVVDSVDSTNTELIERARGSAGRRQADALPALLVAEHQTRGRGRQGHEWQSSRGASLTFSLALPLAPASWSGLSLAVGVALADALDGLDSLGSAPHLGLKWPNDVWLLDAPASPNLGRKLAGVLIETAAVGSKRLCVVGVGINVLPLPAPGALSSGQAALSELVPPRSAVQALHAVAAPLVRALLRFQAEGFAPFAPAYARRDLLLGQAITTTLAELPLGVAQGVDESGALRVQDAATPPRVHRVSSGEVSVRLAPTA